MRRRLGYPGYPSYIYVLKIKVMFEEVKDTDIKEVSTWNSGDTVTKDIGYDRVTMLEPTAKNMHMLMLKINELVVEINKIKQ